MAHPSFRTEDPNPHRQLCLMFSFSVTVIKSLRYERMSVSSVNLTQFFIPASAELSAINDVTKGNRKLQPSVPLFCTWALL